MAYAEVDREAAAKMLRIAAKYIRAGEPLPFGLSNMIADAFERAARVPAKARPAELARALRLTYPGRRPKAPWVEVGYRVEVLCGETGSENEAIRRVAEERGIEESTVRRMWKTYCAARDEHNATE